MYSLRMQPHRVNSITQVGVMLTYGNADSKNIQRRLDD